MSQLPFILAVLAAANCAIADDIAAYCADRRAIERVYHQHRLGDKPPFEQTLPQATLEKLVRQDAHKEAVLQKEYGIRITPALLDAEVQRINATTRAPEMLVEIKTALGNDPTKFAQAFAKPFLVERLLRDKFDNDDALHATQRREAETVRGQLLEARSGLESTRHETAAGKSEVRSPESAGNPEPQGRNGLAEERVVRLVDILRTNTAGQFSETTWQTGKRPAESTPAGSPDEFEIKKRFGPNAQIISSPRPEKDWKLYFEDLPSELQRVLHVQLRRPGDVSAVIETPGGFLLYVCKENTPGALGVAALSLPKRSYEQWLKGQSEEP